MTRYRMDGGVVVDTDKASASWDERTYHDGRNFISKATGDQWTHETLYRSRKGRYYVEHTSQWSGSTSSAEWVSNAEAARWLAANDYSPESKDWPAELTEHYEQVVE